MIRLPARPVPFTQRGLTLIELMISMLLGLIVVGGVLGIFAANSETHRRTDDLARVQENARIAVQFMNRSMREASGNPCGLPPNMDLIFHAPGVSTSNWWSGGNDFKSSLRGYAGGNGFPARGGVEMVVGSDAFIAVSGNSFAKTVISDNPPGGAMEIHAREGFADNDILFACSKDKGLGVVFKAGGISASGARWRVNRATPFVDAVENMKATALGGVSAEGWFVGRNTRGGSSLFRAFIGDGGQPEEIAPDVSGMNIQYLLPDKDEYVPANEITSEADWSGVVAAYIELTISKKTGSSQPVTRTVGMTINLRNRFELNTSDPSKP